MTELLPPTMEDTRRNLIALRNEHGADSPVGHRISNIIELLQMPSPPADLVERQVSDLERLLAGPQ